jgi:hypothetical protein
MQASKLALARTQAQERLTLEYLRKGWYNARKLLAPSPYFPGRPATAPCNELQRVAAATVSTSSCSDHHYSHSQPASPPPQPWPLATAWEHQAKVAADSSQRPATAPSAEQPADATPKRLQPKRDGVGVGICSLPGMVRGPQSAGHSAAYTHPKGVTKVTNSASAYGHQHRVATVAP